ncbi:alpha/beta hydrolase [Phycicoccus sp. BSK3Z-2]|uniref:Alpha/beta hydrolase n=1 Tax=Phycicoccus avicenniae TaxID=2828860 RepID=A0A941HZ10_9MICO|nr:alpha/beta hydrolase [Phycicoccus avicenniae]MBR7741756.1 alpha/beta hydrolase [Phycicoccus avicenniae]
MPLDPYLADRLHLLDGVTWPRTVEPEVAARLARWAEDPGAYQAPKVATEDRVVPGDDANVPVRVYRPVGAGDRPAGDGDRLVVWVHGGGFAAGDLDMRESHVVSLELADRLGATVVSVGYRLVGGDVRYPAPVDDVQSVWEWATTRLVPHPRTAVLGGASAGACLVLSVACRTVGGAGTPDGLLLVYPFVHHPVPPLDAALAGQMATLPPLLRFTAEEVDRMAKEYVGRLDDLPAEAFPGSSDLHGLPPTHVVVSEYDDLRPSAERLVHDLREAGVATSRHLAVGMPHGHLDRTPALPEVDRSLAAMAGFVRGLGAT